MTITDERKKNVDFSDPYFEATQAVLVDKDSRIGSLADVKAKGKSSAPRRRPPARTTPRPRATTRCSFESSDAVLNGLRTGQVQAVVIDYPVVQGWLKDKATAAKFKVVDNLKTGEQYGFTVKKGNKALLDAINKALKTAKADGTYKKIYEQWIGPYDASVASPAAS
ncbi:transporter substrate-binding domain-containing protein [Streptomyces tricolor]|nr:transporter substrate-binding domain-containing protein [Streptomyces tricolor]